MGNYAAWCKTSSEQGHPLSALPSTKQSNNSTFNESCHIFVRDVFTTFQAFAFRFLKFLIQTKSQEMCEDTVSVNNHADTFMVYNSNHSLKRIMVFCLQVRAFFFFHYYYISSIQETLQTFFSLTVNICMISQDQI